MILFVDNMVVMLKQLWRGKGGGGRGGVRGGGGGG